LIEKCNYLTPLPFKGLSFSLDDEDIRVQAAVWYRSCWSILTSC